MTSTPGDQQSVFHLVIHSGYVALSIGLYNCATRLAVQTLDKKTVSAYLMQSIMDMLTEHTLKFTDLSYITAHSGPAPFTTLRVGIATANGIGYATGIPLIGINGLETLSKSYPEYTVILNAFCDDVYIGKNGEASCENIDKFLELQAATIKEPVTYIGNGVALHHEKIQLMLGRKVHILSDYPYEADIEMIAQAGYTKWLNKIDIVNQIIPTYLKQYSARISS